jgi:hypothetical protein
VKKFLATAAALIALSAPALADDQGDLASGIALLTVSTCIAPTIDPAKEEDFNYLSDAMHLASMMGYGSTRLTPSD